MNKRTILAFIDWYRPGYKAGGTVTSFGNFVDYLEDNFDFNIVTRDTDFLENKTYNKITSDSWNKINKSHCYYISNTSLTYGAIKKIILKSSFDFIYINGVFSFYFSILPVFFAVDKICILNPHGMLSDQAFSVKSYKKRIYLTIANALSLYKNVVFHVSNEDEANAVRKRIKTFKSVKIANQFPRKLNHKIKTKLIKHNPTRFINVARISIEKGTLIMLEALRDIEEPIELDLYGPIYDESYWIKCQNVISQLPKSINVTYKGVIDSKDVPNTLIKYDFFVLLSEGENFGHAIIEALSVGLPVIISNRTPWKDLEKKTVGWDTDIQNKSDIMNALNNAIKMSDVDYVKWSTSAADFAEEFNQNPELLEQNKSLFLTSLKHQL